LVQPLPGIAATADTRADHSRFLHSIAGVDRAFATVINALETSEYANDTLVVITTDHGVAQPRYKCNLNAGGLGIACIIGQFGYASPGRYCDALASNVDMFPTLCELLGLETPAYVQGEGFAHLVHNPNGEHRTHHFSEIDFHTSCEPMRAVRTGQFSYVRNFDSEYPFTHLSNIDNSPAKSVLLRRGEATRQKAPAELYDVESDPLERHNLIGDEGHARQEEELEATLAQWRRDSNDPLLPCPISPPQGSTVNTPDCVEPDSTDPTHYRSLRYFLFHTVLGAPVDGRGLPA
jgi:arylsulfatase A-like enzyme